MVLLERETRRLSVPSSSHRRTSTASSTRSNARNVSHPELLRHYGALWDDPPPPNTHDALPHERDGEGSPEAETFQAGSGAAIPPPSCARPSLSHRHTRLFRILKLYPRLEIELRAFSLLEMPDYVAVSHRWGEEAASTVILINDESLLMLKPSLISCIQNVAEFTGVDTWFWVDGVCIEQNDEAEKAQQVKLLWKIFGDAERVLMYLGEGDSDTSRAVFAMKNYALTRAREADGDDWDVIWRFLNRAWFSRLWTMQEAILAKELLVLCGEDSIEWADVAYVYSFVSLGPESQARRDQRTWEERIRIGSLSIDAIISLRRWRNDHGEREPQYARQILHLMTSQDCFLEVDRVYAVLGLFPPDVMSQIDVDYSRGSRLQYWTTYHQFGQALLTSLGRNSMPVLSTLKDLTKKTYSCPGWVPDWCPDFSQPKPGFRRIGWLEEIDD